MSSTRVLIVDDHPVFRSGLTLLVDTIPGMAVIGQADNGQEAFEFVQNERPDVILMDIDMPILDGIASTELICKAHPAVHVLILTMIADGPSLLRAMQAGARGYLLKGASQDEITRAIHAVTNGEMLFGADMVHHLMALAKSVGESADPHRHSYAHLTDREYELFVLIGQSKSNQEIARLMNLTPKTVRNYVSRLLDKLDVDSRDAATALAQSTGVV